MVYIIIFLLTLVTLFSTWYVYAARSARKARGDAWTVEKLFRGFNPSLALDPSSRNPRISYYDGRLAFAKPEVSWVTEIVDDGDCGDESSLAIDQVTGYPKIAYRAYTPELSHHIRYAEWDGARWTIEAVGVLEEGHSAAYVSLALDPRRQEPRIVYVDQTDEEPYLTVRYLARNDGEWATEVVGPAGGSASPSLAMTSRGEPNIAYRSGCHLVFAARSEGTWVTEDVTLVGDSGYDSSLCLRADDTPVIAYGSTVPVGLFCFDVMDVAKKEDSGWSVERPVPDVIDGLCLALEQETDYPCISFYNKAENHLKYVSWDGVAWVEEFVDDTEGVHFLAMKSSLVLTPGTNSPRIAYVARDYPISEIRYAWRD